jgi:hypothetical protein
MIRLARLEDCAVIKAIVRQAYCGYIARIGQALASALVVENRR